HREQGRAQRHRVDCGPRRRHIHGETTMKVGSRESLVVGLCLLAAPAAATAQAINAEGIYKESCAQCHDQPQGRTPSREALKDRSAETILNALTSGSMSLQGLTLSVAERRALAEHLSGKTLAAPTSGGDNRCAANETRLTGFATRQHWNGF